jgi:glucose/mannose transport system substrate-binding protein
VTRNRRSGLAVLAASLALLLAGCGGLASTATSGSTRNLEVLSWWTSGSERAALNVLLDDFRAAHPGIAVRNAAIAGGGGSNAHVVLANRLLGGDPPDVWQTHPGASIRQYIDAGQIANVSPIYQRGNLPAVIRQDLRQAVSADGNEYGVSTGAHRINMLWFNKRLLDKAMIMVPAEGYTADALLADLAKLKATGVPPLCLGAKDPFARAELFENTLLGVIRADGWARLTSDRLDWNGPQVRQALSRFGTLLDYADPEAGALTWDQATKKLATGGCAFESMNDSAYGELVVNGAKEGTDFGYVAYPGTDNLFLTVVDTFVMAKNARNLQNAQAFLATIATVPTQLAFNKQKGSVPLRTDIDMRSLSPYQQSATKALAQDPALLSITHGEAKSPQFQQGFYDAIAAFAQSRDVNVFNQALLDAVNQVAPPPH